MANRIVSVHAGIYGLRIYAIMLPSSRFSVAHYTVKAIGVNGPLKRATYQCDPSSTFLNLFTIYSGVKKNI